MVQDMTTALAHLATATTTDRNIFKDLTKKLPINHPKSPPPQKSCWQQLTLQPNSIMNLHPSRVPMDTLGEDVEGEEIIKATVCRDALWTQMVIVGHMVSGSHATTLANHAPTINPSKKMRQRVLTPWGD